jgi:putative NADPH-quinone reductase
MKVSVIYAHPNKESFNHAIADIAMRTLQSIGYDMVFHDLYKERFDPVLPYEEIPKGALLDPVIREHRSEIANATGIIIVHPN